MKIVLISCVKKKKDYRCRADELYDSSLFKGALGYAKKQRPDKIFILSAKYGLVKPDEILETYDETLNTKGVADRKVWASSVLNDLGKCCDLVNDEFIFLAGEKYREFLITHIKNCKIPLLGLPFGKQLQYYKDRR